MKKNLLFVLLMFLFFTHLSAQEKTTPAWAKKSVENRENRMKWWTQDRSGLFIHWGLYSAVGRHEWVKKFENMSDEQYQKYFDIFNPDLYNPKEWAKQAKDAGMKYFVITTKHHDGFCLWDSKYTDYKSTNTPIKADLLKPMVDAFRAEGLKVGFYYSLIDWNHPDFTMDTNYPRRTTTNAEEYNKGRDMKKYRQYMKNQLTELLTDFGTVDVLFLDYSYPKEDGKGHEDWDSEDILKHVRSLQPDIIVNDRLDLNDTNWGWDIKTPEQFMPRQWVEVDGKKVPWETCQTFSGSWGYHRDENTWKSTDQLIVMLIETVSKGGNLLLNVGPTGRGNFDYRATERLEGLGKWMKFNSPSIYGCTQAPEEYTVPKNCFLTYNPELNRLYVHVTEWPFKSLHLEGYKGKIKYAQLLDDGAEIKYHSPNQPGSHTHETTGENDVILMLPVQKPQSVIPVIELFLE